MVEVFGESQAQSALYAGVLRGAEVATMHGQLIAPSELIDVGPLLGEARHLAEEVVAQSGQPMPEWRQLMTGEVVAAAFLARQMEGNLDELQPQVILEVLDGLWGLIDRWW